MSTTHDGCNCDTYNPNCRCDPRETEMSDTTVKRLTLMDYPGWQEVKLWVVECNECRTQAMRRTVVMSPPNLPPGWTWTPSNHVICDVCHARYGEMAR